MFETTTAVANLTDENLLMYVRKRNLPEAARRVLEKTAELKRGIASEDAALRRLQMEIDQIFQDQQRFRENINSLNRLTRQQDQVQRYAKQLSDQERQLAELREERSGVQSCKAALEGELNRLLETASF